MERRDVRPANHEQRSLKPAPSPVNTVQRQAPDSTNRMEPVHGSGKPAPAPINVVPPQGAPKK